jgi:hypothetical protein
VEPSALAFPCPSIRNPTRSAALPQTQARTALLQSIAIAPRPSSEHEIPATTAAARTKRKERRAHGNGGYSQRPLLTMARASGNSSRSGRHRTPSTHAAV